MIEILYLSEIDSSHALNSENNRKQKEKRKLKQSPILNRWGVFEGKSYNTKKQAISIESKQKIVQSHYQNTLEKLEDSQKKPKPFMELIFPSKKNPEFSIVKGHKMALIFFAVNF